MGNVQYVEQKTNKMEPIYEERKFMIFSVSELNKIDFDEVIETSIDTVRKSVDETKTFVKWIGDTPSTVSSLLTKEGPYAYDIMINILKTSEWENPNPANLTL
jgi:hypothetical protein